MEQNNEFIHTGIQHTRIEEGHSPVGGPNSSTNEFKYVLDQNDYASAIKPVSLPELMKATDEDSLGGLLLDCVLTLLGVVAWLLQTRMDSVVYASALQRKMQQPRAVELRRLHRVIRWVQRHPNGV